MNNLLLNLRAQNEGEWYILPHGKIYLRFIVQYLIHNLFFWGASKFENFEQILNFRFSVENWSA